MLAIPIRIMVRDKYPQYSSNWFYHNTMLAVATREWRKTNTLKSVK